MQYRPNENISYDVGFQMHFSTPADTVTRHCFKYGDGGCECFSPQICCCNGCKATGSF